jgi:hypothetical protein
MPNVSACGPSFVSLNSQQPLTSHSSRKLSERPTKAELEQRNILKEEGAETISKQSMEATRKMLLRKVCLTFWLIYSMISAQLQTFGSRVKGQANYSIQRLRGSDGS